MTNTLHKYITAFHYTETTLLVLSSANSGVFLGLFRTVIGTAARIASVCISLVFLISTGIVTMFLKEMEREKINTEILLYWLEVN